MAHEFESGFFVKQPAWHGLGTVLQAPPTIEEALKLAGLDWTVRLERLGRMVQPPIGLGTIPPAVFTEANRWAVVRESDNTELGTVGKSWRALQNKTAFAWFQPIVDAGLATLEAAGSLKHGGRVWVLAKISTPADIIVEGDARWAPRSTSSCRTRRRRRRRPPSQVETPRPGRGRRPGRSAVLLRLTRPRRTP